MICKKCNKPISTAENTTYNNRCEECFLGDPRRLGNKGGTDSGKRRKGLSGAWEGMGIVPLAGRPIK
jgi:hypothetical protein